MAVAAGCAAVLCFCVFAWAGVAQAATVSLSVQGSPGSKYAEVLYVAGADEVSTVRLDLVGDRFTIADATTSLQALSGCQQVDAHTVVCDTTARAAELTLGGGPDDFSFGTVEPNSRLYTKVTGGPKGNRIDGSRGTGELVVTGGPGDDTMIGGPGDDYFTPGAGSNTIDGGAGTNTVDFDHSLGPVHASLADGTASAPGERDALQHIQNLNGSPYDDVLIGDDGPNWLTGGLGDDVLIGRGGDDHLDGDGATRAESRSAKRADHDLLFGGTGNDSYLDTCAATIVTGPGAATIDLSLSGLCGGRTHLAGSRRTEVFCGSPHDTVESPNKSDELIGCKRVLPALSASHGTPPPPRLTRHWGASYFVPCDWKLGPCLLRLTLKVFRHVKPAVILGRTTVRPRSNRQWNIRTTLSAPGRAYLRAHPNTLVDVSLSTSDWANPYALAGEYLVPIRPMSPPVEP